ncbi:hypothetical protein H072_10833 [Dactylellina haptotyla CBS 200.50]|uniref:Metallo-beta-lactamase domain-containing protein n=1 Tax=Dactylellina haptotyla (strain CBS 200.50) TaxID=1284197 RepID=S8B9C2_DACHA|nr:hypothetical protein H072_10833 [Dactylellina haptotyla CBS 200.50]
MAAQLVPLPEIERLSSRVIRILGGNPGKFTLQGTNTYLVGTGRRRILIDAAEGKPAWKASLSSVLESESATISTAIITHWHPDHVLGVKDLRSLCPDVKVYKSRLSPDDGAPGRDGYYDIKPDHDIEDEQEFQVDGATLTAYHTPGHASDHVCLMLKEEEALFTGDNVLGQGTTVFEDLSQYLSSLQKMLSLAPKQAYPAHGPLIEDVKAKISEYIAHRQERVDQVLQVLKEHSTASTTSMDIVKVIYKDYPENLYEAAERGVIQILDLLVKEGKAIKDNGKWRIKESQGAGGSPRSQGLMKAASVL